jgi:nicotinate-nucleotide adenylyltransferase
MKIGLFFGSFNPIHIGHLAIANYIVEYTDIDKLWFVVSPHNPLKQKKNLLNDYQRLEMVNRAIFDDLRFKACDIEFKLPRPSYTINTLTYLKEKYPDHEFLLIIGSDNYANLEKWKNYEILLSEYHFIIYPRPDFTIENIYRKGSFTIVDAPLIEISSTFIRKALSEKRDIRHFLHPEVFKYIDEMGFYR